MDKQPVSPSSCANCATPLEPQFRFCPQCSQKTNLHRLNLHDVFHDAIHYFTHADKGFLGVLKDLATKTGTVAREYVTGKRKKYFPPLNFFLIAGTIYLVILSLANPAEKYNAMEEAEKAIPKIRQAPKHVQEYVLNMYERQHKAISLMTKYSNTVQMIALPLTCLVFWLFYYRGRFNYTEHLIANMYLNGFSSIVNALVFTPIAMLFGMRQNKPSTISLIFVVSVFVFQLVYAAVFYYHFMGKRTALAAWKAAGVSLFSLLLWIALAGGLIFLYVLHGFWGLFK